MWKHAMVLAVATSACGPSSDSLELEQLNTLMSATSGIAIEPNGYAGRASMGDRMCYFQTLDGLLTDALELEPNSRVLDGFRDRTLIVTQEETWLADAGVVTAEPWVLVNGRVNPAGYVGVKRNESGCQLVWNRWGASQILDVASSVCDPDMDMELLAGGAVLVAAGHSLFEFSVEGGRLLAANVDIVATNVDGTQHFVAERGSSVVRALGASGLELWQTAVDGAIVDLATLRVHGAVAVMTDDEGAGLITTLDVESGKVRTKDALPAASPMTASASGNLIGLTTDSSVTFYGTGVSIKPDPVEWTDDEEVDWSVRGDTGEYFGP